MNAGLLKVFAAVGIAFALLLAWSNNKAVERHDVRNLQGDSDVTVLSAVWCGYCKAEKAALVAANVPFRELDVETSEEGERAYRAVGGHGIPVTLIGKDVVFGYDEARLRKLLGKKGYVVNF